MRVYSNLLVFFFALTYSLTTIAGSHAGSSSPTNYNHSYTFVGGANSLCKVQFSITGSTRQYLAILYAGTGSSNTISTNIFDYFHKNPKSYAKVDLQNAIKGNKQMVQITSLSANSPIFIQILVASVYSFTYSINITELPTSGFASGCAYPIAVQILNQFCSSCSGSFKSGAYCDYFDISLSNNTQVTRALAPGDYVAFTIPSSSSTITVNYGVDQSYVEIFFQFKTFSDEIAGLANIAVSSSGLASYIVNDPTKTYQTMVTSGGSDVSVGVINQVGVNVNFNIRYTVQQSVNLLIIILGVLGGILLIILIVAACCIIRRMRNPTQMIHPNASALAHQIQIQQNMLSPQEIEIYFPSVSCRIVFTDLQSSSISLNNKQDLIDKDCVICLCPVDVNELMKVTYCRHIFHSHCLVEWFKKQRNCPYCREEYSKSSTVDHYQHLLKESHKNMLAGAQLAKAILMSKIRSSLVIQQVKD